MGKKHKDRDGGKKKGEHSHGEHAPNALRFDVPPQVAGIAAAALRQVNTPAFQQLIAGALGAAGQAMGAMAQRSAAERGAAPVPPAPTPTPTPPAPSTPPAPPASPEPPVAPISPEPQAAYRPHFETPPVQLSPEAAEAIERVAHQAAAAIERAADHASRAIETATAGFERWVEKQVRPKTGD